MASRSELRQLVQEQLKLLLEQKNYEGAKTLLVPVQPVDIAEAIEELPESLQAIAFRLLKKQEAIAVYEYLSFPVQQSLIQAFTDQETIDIVDAMSPDDRAHLFDELPPQLVRQILNQLSAQERQVTSQLLGYDANTAGRIMTPEYIAIPENLTALEAQEQIRTLAHQSELAYYIYITDTAQKLMGICSLKDLILASPDSPLTEVMTRDIIYAQTNTDQEEVAQLIQRYDLIALAIVDSDRQLLGVVTVDDVLDIIQEEATEDMYTMAAVTDDGDNYFQKGLVSVTKSRVPWLIILLITNAMTVLIMQTYEEVLDEVVALAFFTPLLIDAGGNVGAQSSTVVIRGLSTDELRGKQPLGIVLRELMAGGMLGLILGILVIVLVLLFIQTGEIAVTVGLSLFAITAIAATTGAALPFIFHKMGFDPALMSAPFITTVVDILGILIYLNTAKLLLGL